ncbi:MAG: hypothetical protein SVW02_02035, partial [Candidatus Nanohaloarchaea archaeon]|nr:hypothetical protein [Candidatus Nanohaloarchaea archaeon]
ILSPYHNISGDVMKDRGRRDDVSTHNFLKNKFALDRTVTLGEEPEESQQDVLSIEEIAADSDYSPAEELVIDAGGSITEEFTPRGLIRGDIEPGRYAAQILEENQFTWESVERTSPPDRQVGQVHVYEGAAGVLHMQVGRDVPTLRYEALAHPHMEQLHAARHSQPYHEIIPDPVATYTMRFDGTEQDVPKFRDLIVFDRAAARQDLFTEDVDDIVYSRR